MDWAWRNPPWGSSASVTPFAMPPPRGARPLRRAILKQVQDPLAESLLGNRYPEGTTIKVGLDGEKFTFTV